MDNSENWLKSIILSASKPEKLHKCEFCSKEFSLEKSFMNHVCVQKTRFLQKNENRVRYGFYAFNRFYKISMGAKKDKTYEEFSKSKYYNSFVKFGSFLVNVRPLNVEHYIDFVIKSKVKLDKWCDAAMYERYAIDYVKKESVTTALERSISTMMKWAEKTENEWNTYFKKVSTNRLTWDIKDGKISPWLILNCESGRNVLSSLNDEQLSLLTAHLDPQFWAIKFRRAKDDVDLVKSVIKEGNI